MTDNPIEVQEEIERARRELEHRMNWCSDRECFACSNNREAIDAYRTAILKHDLVVTGLDAAVSDVLGKLKPVHNANAYRQIHSRHLRQLTDALEAYRTAVSEEHGG